MDSSMRMDDPRSLNFRIESDGVTIASFTDVTGLTDALDAPDSREASDLPRTIRGLPGSPTYSSVILERGFTASPEMWSWYRGSADGVAGRRNVSIVLMDERHRDVRRWNLRSAWVSKIESADLNATGNEVPIESLELTAEGITLEG